MIYLFRDFEIDDERFELTREREPIVIQRLALATLIYLVEHRDRVVTKDELISGPWRGVNVSDAALAQTISQIRRVIGDRGDREATIKTVRGEGFRFSAAVDARPSGAAHESGLVDRVGELRRLRERMVEATAGHGSVAFVTGEPGIGKTTLVVALARAVGADGTLAVFGQCGGASPLDPWVQVVRRLLERAPTGDSETSQAAREMAQLFPELRNELGGPLGSERYDSLSARLRMFEAVATFVQRRARAHPLLIVIEDLHLADDASLLLLEQLSRRVANARVLLLATYRATEIGPVLRETLSAVEAQCELRLEGLTARDVGTLLHRLTNESPQPDVVERVHRLTHGNPLMIDQVCQHAAGRGGLAAVTELESVRVPDRIVYALRRRIEELPSSARDVLVVAAVVGLEFDAAVVGEVIGVPPDAVLDALDVALRRGIVHELGRGRWGFSHGLMQETLRAEILPSARAQTHLQIANALETSLSAGRAVPVAQIAHHLSEAAPVGGTDRAVDYQLRAARDAARRLAYEAAARHYDRAATVLALGAPDPRVLLAVLLDLGRIRRVAGQYHGAIEAFTSAAAIAREHGAAKELAFAAVGYGETQTVITDPVLKELLEEALAKLDRGDSELRARLLARLAIAVSFERTYAMRDELARESLAMARRIGDDRTLALVLNAYRWCLRATAPAEEALALSTEAVTRAEASGDASLANEVRVWKIADALQNEDVGTVDRERRRLRDESALLQEAWHQVFVLRYEATWALMQGRFDEAEPKIAAALQAGEKVGDGISSLVFWVQMLVLRREQGAFLDLEPVGLQIVATMPWNPAWKATLALMYAESGRLDEAHRFFGELAADRFALPPDMNELVSLAQLAETCAILGEREHAKALRDLLAPHAARTIIIAAAIASFGPVAYYLGLLDLARGARTEAVAQFEDGIRRSQRLGAEAWRIRCAEGLARALWESKSRRDRERGIGVLAEVIAAASDRLMTGLLESSRRADTKLFDAASARQRERATKGPATR